MKIGLIGLGYWGPNYLRVFSEIKSAEVAVCCDKDSSKLMNVKKSYPHIRCKTDYLDVIKDEKIDAICISTPASSHYEIAKKALTSSKHVLVEKPFVLSSKQGVELIELAKDKERVLMVGHVYLFHPAVEKVKEILASGDLGNVYYTHSTRTGLGPIREDVNAAWDLAPHDLSILLYLFDRLPEEVSMWGAAFLRNNIEDVAVINMKFPHNLTSYIHVSWLDPYKTRKLTIVGDKKMLVFDDTSPLEKIKIFDRGVDRIKTDSSYGEFLTTLRFGDIYCPWIDTTEPLKNQCNHFIECIQNGKEPKTSGENSLIVIKILEAAEKSLRSGGKAVRIDGV